MASYIQQRIGDVLLTLENEAFLIAKDMGGEQFDVVYPSVSIEAAHPVAIVATVTLKMAARRLPRPIRIIYGRKQARTSSPNIITVSDIRR